jgi:hypothetical protein
VVARRKRLIAISLKRVRMASILRNDEDNAPLNHLKQATRSIGLGNFK